jgi:uncharacterized RDD family membrane protein YckC
MDPSHQTLLNQARQNASQGNIEKSLNLLKKLIEISRNDIEVQATAYFEIGKIYTGINKDDLAVKFLNKAISLSPDVLIQEIDWLQDLKKRNKKHIFDEIEKTQSEFREYLLEKTKDAGDKSSCVSSDKSEQAPSLLEGRISADNNKFKYAGFWKRVVSSIVDSIIIFFVNLVLLIVLIYGFGLTIAGFLTPTHEEAFLVGGLMGYLVWYFISILLLWLYYVIMESSRCQGTLGKMLLGIYITDQHGRRIGIGRATGRYFLRILLFSVPLLGLIDCLMVAVTEKKQAWHDMPVGCLVLSKG